MSFESSLQPTAKKNVETIAQAEQQLLRQRSRMERVGEGIARFFGSLYFIVAHVLFIAGWVLVNINIFPGVPSFDPYPFALLAAVVGIEYIFLTPFVLMNQKHQIRRTEQWANLHLQLSMLTEQEVTKNMQMLHLICQHLRLKQPGEHHQEVKELTQATPVTALVDGIGKVRELGHALSDEICETQKAEATADGEGKRQGCGRSLQACAEGR
jgi:uncharacterized membrane protein